MPIVVACQCGQRFQARDELAGRQAKCPKCGSILTIPRPAARSPASSSKPAASPLDDILDDAGIDELAKPRCPECHAELKPGAVLCVACGYDLKSGKQLQTKVVGAEEEDPAYANLPTHGNDLLDRAEREIVRQRLQEERLQRGAPWWVFLVALILCGVFVSVAVRLRPNPLLMAGIVAGGLFEFTLLAASFAGACSMYMAFRRARGPVSQRDEVPIPPLGYTMGIFIAALGVTAVVMAVALPLFGIYYWKWEKPPESLSELPHGVPIAITAAVAFLFGLVLGAKLMLPARFKHAAICVGLFLVVAAVVNGLLYLLFIIFSMFL